MQRPDINPCAEIFVDSPDKRYIYRMLYALEEPCVPGGFLGQRILIITRRDIHQRDMSDLFFSNRK